MTFELINANFLSMRLCGSFLKKFSHICTLKDYGKFFIFNFFEVLSNFLFQLKTFLIKYILFSDVQQAVVRS